MPAIVTHGLTVTCVKISVLLLYRRIFVTKAFRRVTVVVGTLSMIWLFANILGQVLLCSPMSAAWDPNSIFSDKCRDVQAIYYGVSVSNMLLDIIILFLPVPLIWGLPLSRAKKFGLCGIFSLGGLWVFFLVCLLQFAITHLKKKKFHMLGLMNADGPSGRVSPAYSGLLRLEIWSTKTFHAWLPTPELKVSSHFPSMFQARSNFVFFF